MAENEAPKKIIIDEDWKSQVQREKEEAAKKAEESKPEPGKKTQPEELTFTAFTSSLGMQAMMALGFVAPRDSKEVYVDLESARFVIDALMLLRAKTKGNLTPEEEGHLTQMLAELQQAYVVRSQQLHEATLQNAGAGLDLNKG